MHMLEILFSLLTFLDLINKATRQLLFSRVCLTKKQGSVQLVDASIVHVQTHTVACRARLSFTQRSSSVLSLCLFLYIFLN